MTAHFSRTPLGVGRGARWQFYTDPLMFNVFHYATQDEDTPERWQLFFDTQLALVREYLAAPR